MPERRRSESNSNAEVGSSSDRALARALPASTPPTPSLLGDRAAAIQLPEDSPDRYELHAEHARGGLGRILKARDGRLGRTVAIKELLRTSEAAESRFIREALITARLQHPGIVPVHEAGRWPSGDPYYVMPLIAGESLKQLIRERASLQERLALLPNVIAVAETIAYAHSESVIHRDLKPSNIVVGEFGETVVVDWGLAKDLRAPPTDAEDDATDATSSSETETAGVIGTPAFMPPEQAEGGRSVTERTDVYALGAMLYNVLAGEPPYSGSEASDVVAKVLAGPPRAVGVLVDGIPRDLVAIVGKAMARDPEQRYPTARELADDLKRFQTGKLVTAYEYSRMTLARRWLWRNRGAAAVAFAALTVVAVIGVLGVNRIVDERNVAQSQRAQAELAQQATERRSAELLFLQAKTSLDRDPTAAIAWLKRYPDTARNFNSLPQMIDDARARGVAKHVFRLGDWAMGVAFSPDSQTVATTSKTGDVQIWSLATGAGRLLGTHSRPANAVQFSPDGRTLATSDASGTIRVWNLESGHFEELVGHVGEVSVFLFAADGTRLISAANDRTARVWDLATNTELEVLRPTDKRSVGGFSSDGNFLAAVNQGGLIQIFDTRTGMARELTTALPPTARAAVSRGGSQIAVLGKDQIIRLVDTTTAEIRELGPHPGAVEWLWFSPTDRFVISTGNDHTVRLFEVDPDAKDKVRIFRGHTDSVYQAVFSSDESVVVSAGDDGTARVWTTETGASHVLSGHDDDVWRVAISPDGKHVATASLDSTVRVWSTTFDDSRPIIGAHAGRFVSVLGFAGDGHDLTLYSIGGEIRVFDTASGTSRAIGTPISPIESMMMIERGVVFLSQDGRYAAARGDKSIQLWSLGDGSIRELRFHEDDVYGLAFSPDGNTLATAGKDGTVVAWDTTTIEHRVIAQGGPVTALEFAPDGDMLALAVEGNVLLWSVGRRELIREVDVSEQCGDKYINTLKFSDDGRQLAVMAHGSTYPVVNLETGAMIELATDGHTLIDVSFSPDNMLIAAAVADRTVRVWNIASGKQEILPGHRDLVMQVRFSPDSQTLASASYDKTVRLWQRGEWRSRVLRGHGASIDVIAFTADGRVLASGSRDGTIRLWNPSLDSLETPDDVRERLDAITTSVIGDDDLPATPQ